MKPEIITGLTSFEKIRTGRALYVDKTLFVWDVFHAGSEAVLILRPRRWGKSLNLNMLNYFLEAPLREGSQTSGEIDLEKLEEKKVFFKTKKILLEHPEMEEHLGKYTVLSLSLSGMEVEDRESLKRLFNQAIGQLFRSLSPFLQSSLQESEKRLFSLYANAEAELADLSKSLSFLSPLLTRVYKRPLFLLLDEYDAAVNSAWEKVLKKMPGAEELLEQLVGFLGSFYENSVKGNPHLSQAVFTGVFRILKGSVGTSMNNFKEDYLLGEKFARDFGFTQDELKTVFVALEIPAAQQETKLEEAKAWYNGYQSDIGPIYNPWSVMSWLESGKARNYWVNMGSLDLLLGISQYHSYTEELSQLVLKKTIQGTLLWGLVLRQCAPGSARLKDAFWTLLIFSGYVGLEKELEFLGDQIRCDLRLPNREIADYFKACLISDFRNRHEMADSDFQVFIQGLLDGRVEHFEEKLHDFLRRIVSPLDVGAHRIEAFYQGFFLGLIAHCEPHYFIRSEFPAGEGRADLLLIPKPHYVKKKALLLEYKVGKKAEDLEALAQEALDQVLEKDYHAEVESHLYVVESTSIGLSFSGKAYVLKSRHWQRNI